VVRRHHPLEQDARLLERSFDDNPLGQYDEQTPIGIWRELIAD